MTDTDQTTAPPWANTEAARVAEAEAAAAEEAGKENPLPVTANVTVTMLDELGRDHPVGIREIANALGVKRQTVDAWKAREWFPDPAPTTLGSRPWWRWGDIRDWAVTTGRLVQQPDPVPADGSDDDADAQPVTFGAPRHPRTPTRS